MGSKSPNIKTDLRLEDVTNQIGEFGRYQLWQSLLHMLGAFLAGVHMLSYSFVGAIPGHRCFIEPVDSVENGSSSRDVSGYIPLLPNGKLSSCSKYDLETNTTVVSCDRFVYDSEYFHSSRVIDWNMVCEREWMRALLQTIFMFGVLCGAVILGSLSDLYGRKPIFCASGLLQLIFGMTSAFISNYYVYAICLFFYGAFGSGGAYVTGFVLSMELVGASRRTVVGISFSAAFAFGMIVVVLWAYLFPYSHQTLQIIYASHAILLIGHFWLIDESMRWLWTQDKIKQCVKIARKAAKVNNLPFNVDADEIKVTTTIDEDNSENPSLFSVNFSKDSWEPAKPSGIKLLLQRPTLRCRTLNMAFNFFANSAVYYGLTLNSGNLHGNPYLLYLFNGLVELPACVIVVAVVDRSGRRSLVATMLLIGGVACAIVAFIPEGTVVTVISMLSKLAISGSFAVMYNYASELFPTAVRTSAMGVTSMAARLGGLLTPQIILLKTVDEKLPLMIFGGIALTASFLTLFLPETLNRALPQTIDEGENFGKGDTAFRSIYKCCGKRSQKYVIHENVDDGDVQHLNPLNDNSSDSTISSKAFLT